MRRFIAVISVLAVFFVTASSFLTVGVKAQNEVAWVYDYPTGMKAAAGGKQARDDIHSRRLVSSMQKQGSKHLDG
jgi:hypothetical protein